MALHNIFSKLADFFDKMDERLNDKREPEEYSRKDRKAVKTVFDDLEKKLNGIKSNKSISSVGCINIIRLDDFKKNLSEYWSKNSEKLDHVVEKRIRQNLSPYDLHWRIGKHGYVIIFQALTTEQAKVKCNLIKGQIEKTVNKNGTFESGIQIQTAVASADGNISLRDVDELNELVNKMLDKENKKAPKEKQKTEETNESDGHFVYHDDSIDAANKELTGLSFHDCDIWDTETRQVIASALLPHDPTPKSLGRHGSVLTEWAGGSLTMALDAVSLNNAKNTEEKNLYKNQKTWFQTHIGSYEKSKFRYPLLQAWGTLQTSYQSRRILEIVGVGKNETNISKIQYITSLGNHVSELALCLDLLHPQVDILKHLHVQWVGFSMKDYDLKENELLDALTNFSSLANKYSLKAYMRDTPDMKTTQAAIAFGIRYIINNDAQTIEEDGFDVGALYR